MSYLRKVTPGQKLEISAQAWNTLMDMANDWLASRQGGRGGRVSNANNPTILVKNSSGVDCVRYDVLGIDNVVITPEANEPGFLSGIAFSGIIPSDTSHASGKFCILAEPIANGKIGKAWTHGICPAWISVTDEAHTNADLIDGDVYKLQSSDSGPLVILWKEAGTGDKWAVVRFGSGGAGGASGGDIIWLDVIETIGYPNPAYPEGVRSYNPASYHCRLSGQAAATAWANDTDYWNAVDDAGEADDGKAQSITSVGLINFRCIKDHKSQTGVNEPDPEADNEWWEKIEEIEISKFLGREDKDLRDGGPWYPAGATNVPAIKKGSVYYFVQPFYTGDAGDASLRQVRNGSKDFFAAVFA